MDSSSRNSAPKRQRLTPAELREIQKQRTAAKSEAVGIIPSEEHAQDGFTRSSHHHADLSPPKQTLRSQLLDLTSSNQSNSINSAIPSPTPIHNRSETRAVFSLQVDGERDLDVDITSQSSKSPPSSLSSPTLPSLKIKSKSKSRPQTPKVTDTILSSAFTPIDPKKSPSLFKSIVELSPRSTPQSMRHQIKANAPVIEEVLSVISQISPLEEEASQSASSNATETSQLSRLNGDWYDCSIKSRMRIFSRESLSWCTSCDPSKAIMSFVQSKADLSREINFRKSLMFWGFTPSPNATLLQSTSSSKGENPDDLGASLLRQEYQGALRSLFSTFCAGECAEFYWQTSNYSIIFYRKTVGDAAIEQALVSKTTRGLRAALSRAGICFMMPRSANPQKATTVDPAVKNEIEELGGRLSTPRDRREAESIEETFLAITETESLTRLVDYLCEHRISADYPSIASSTPFLNGTLRCLRVSGPAPVQRPINSAGDLGQGVEILNMVEIEGQIFPWSFRAIIRLLEAHHEADFDVYTKTESNSATQLSHHFVDALEYMSIKRLVRRAGSLFYIASQRDY